MRRRRFAFFTLLLLVSVVTIPVVLMWRAVRQEQLNHALIAAVGRNDVAAVRRVLHAGADPNTQILPEDGRPMWKRILDLLQRRPLPHPLRYESALMMSVEWLPNPNDDSNVIDNADTLEALATVGADVNMKGGKYPARTSTPLIEAARLEKWNTVRVLLAHLTQPSFSRAL